MLAYFGRSLAPFESTWKADCCVVKRGDAFASFHFLKTENIKKSLSRIKKKKNIRDTSTMFIGCSEWIVPAEKKQGPSNPHAFGLIIDSSRNTQLFFISKGESMCPCRGCRSYLATWRETAGRAAVPSNMHCRAGLGPWCRLHWCANASAQTHSLYQRQDTLKLDLFVVIRRRQIPLALIWLNEVCVYSCDTSLHMVLIQ